MIFQSGLISALFSAQGGNIARSNRSSTSNQIECRHANLLCMHHISNWPATSGNGIPKTAVISMPHKTVSREIWPYHQDHKKIHSSYNPPKKNMFPSPMFFFDLSHVVHTSCAVQDVDAYTVLVLIISIRRGLWYWYSKINFFNKIWATGNT